MLRVLCAVLLVAAFGATPAVAQQPQQSLDNRTVSTSHTQVTAVYPNPVATEDTGEFVTLRVPSGKSLSGYTLGDGETVVSLRARSRRTGDDREITFSTAPSQTRSLTDRQVRSIPKNLSLANSEETLRLRHNGTVIDRVEYTDTTEGELLNVTADEWRPLAATDFPVVSATGGTVEAFVLPDAPGRAVELLRSAERRILLAGYTLSSRQVVDALSRAHRRGVRVEVLLEGGPVGGISGQSSSALDTLTGATIPVSMLDGERARYRFHHAKYAVVDDRAVVTTENWKPAGTGGHASRGWAVITRQTEIVEGLVRTFEADTGWQDTVSWEQMKPVDPVEGQPANRSYPSEFSPQQVPVEQTELLVTPDNAQRRLLDCIQNATESIAVKQVSIGDREFPLLEATVRAAKRGVEVRVLLSSAWYTKKENRKLVEWLNERASREDLPLSARLARPGDSFEKIHAKGLIVDSQHVAVGSANWNNNSFRQNREVLLLLSGKRVAGYYEEVFEADWNQSGNRDQNRPETPVGLVIACLIVTFIAVSVGLRIRFAGEKIK